ncbi:hypothetical protein PVAND_001874 [Polypedilum vanderplanki]|uniref:non-specific serine/threonine protein kinase n=1 Tax=Polypedilum vanderplanki TaxID=319348 RepID=A0A9J6BP89_POLVA|nr:hypothetical protein PVAND_001874 [Polypedilum vanderplanki]
MDTTLHEIPEEITEEEEENESAVNTTKNATTPYERILHTINDPSLSHEVGLSRIGLYKFCGDIGKGNFSRVKKAIHILTKDKVAIKIVDRSRLDSRNLQMLSREVKTLESLSLHPHILRLFEVIETVGRVYIVSEYLQGELYYHIVQQGVLPEARASKIFKQLAEAIQYIHHLGYVHRDVKAENVLLTADENVKLCDFGFSTQIKSSREFLNTYCGSPPYAAPELFQEDNYLGRPIDIWSLGILLYFILIGNMPFSAPSIAQLKQTIMKGEYKLPGTLSQPCVKLIQCILLHHPLHRPSIDVILGCEWLQQQQQIKEQQEIKKLEEVRTTIQKRKAFWCTKSRRTSPLLTSSSSSQSSPVQKQFIECYTKKFNNAPVETFRNPLENEMLLNTSSAKTIIPINNNLSTFKRNNSLINNSKIVNRKSLQFCQRNNDSQDTACSDDKSETSDVDFESFIMYPTRTNCNVSSIKALNPLEQEVRSIMSSYGISHEKIESEIANAPHSQIIGIYRILIIRILQQREQKEKKIKTPPIQTAVVKRRRKGTMFCSIL